MKSTGRRTSGGFEIETYATKDLSYRRALFFGRGWILSPDWYPAGAVTRVDLSACRDEEGTVLTKVSDISPAIADAVLRLPDARLVAQLQSWIGDAEAAEKA